MRKFLSYTLVLTTVLAFCAGCGKQDIKEENNTSVSENTTVENPSTGEGELFTEKGREIISLFKGIMTYEEVLEDVSEIDLHYQEDFDRTAYREEVVEDKENETAIYQYYDGDRLVYETFEGFAEAGYRVYTKTKSGLNATVNHFEQPFTFAENAHSVSIITDSYSVSFYDGDAEDPLKDTVTITLMKNSDDELEESLTYSLENGSIFLEHAYYRSTDGYHRYWSWMDEVSQGVEEEDEILYKNISEDDISSNIDMLKAYDGTYPIQALLGPHTLSSKDDKWYLTIDLFLIFDKEAEALAYAKNAGLDKDTVSQEFFADDESEKYHVKLEQFTLPIAENFTINGKDFGYFAADMYDDYSFTLLHLNEQDEVESMGYGEGLELTYG